MPTAQAGTIADMTEYNADTGIAEGDIPFGRAVSRGSADNGVIVGGSTFKGIAIRDVTIAHATADRYEAPDNVAVLNRGDIWVQVATDVVHDRQAYYNSSTGEFGDSAIPNDVAVDGAIFLDTASSGGFSRVRLSSSIGKITT
jgi:hypothetical protein